MHTIWQTFILSPTPQIIRYRLRVDNLVSCSSNSRHFGLSLKHKHGAMRILKREQINFHSTAVVLLEAKISSTGFEDFSVSTADTTGELKISIERVDVESTKVSELQYFIGVAKNETELGSKDKTEAEGRLDFGQVGDSSALMAVQQVEAVVAVGELAYDYEIVGLEDSAHVKLVETILELEVVLEAATGAAIVSVAEVEAGHRLVGIVEQQAVDKDNNVDTAIVMDLVQVIVGNIVDNVVASTETPCSVTSCLFVGGALAAAEISQIFCFCSKSVTFGPCLLNAHKEVYFIKSMESNIGAIDHVTFSIIILQP
ncbi:hypothetical protein RYX36_009655 [Vicia faba]